jgi:hypothetical protein
MLNDPDGLDVSVRDVHDGPLSSSEMAPGCWSLQDGDIDINGSVHELSAT